MPDAGLGNDAGLEDDAAVGNRAPGAFTLTSVVNDATNVDLLPAFSWNVATDPDGDVVSYSLYMDASSDPTTEIASGLTGTSLTLTNRLPLVETLFWKVVATDTNGAMTESATFKFTTRNLNTDTLVNGMAQFPEISSHASVVFDNKLWIIGGNVNGFTTNEIWNSDDGGVTWSEVTTIGPVFSGRKKHTTVVFNSDLWLIGGDTGGGVNSNEVWRSSNGINWTEVTSVPIPARNGHTSVVFNNQLWVIAGGGRINGVGVRLNDVWRSDDGVTWNDVTTMGTIFSGRASHSTVVFDDKLWVIGGFDGIRKNDIWSSSDGISWDVLATIGPRFSPRYSHRSVVYDNKLWVMGGSIAGARENDIWSSSNGTAWAPVVNSTPRFSPRENPGVVVFDSKIFLIGGGVATGRINDVWSFD